MTAPVLADYQMQIGSLVMGAGTSYHVTSISGLGQPDRRAKDEPRPLTDGDFLGTSFYGSRSVTIEVSLVASSASAATSLLSTLSDQWRGSSTLYVRQPGWGTRIIFGEPRRMRADDRTMDRFGTIPVELEYYSPYPAMYSDVTTVGAGPYVSGGLTLPCVFPVSFGVGYSGNSVSVTNGGDYPYPPVVRIHGPCTAVTLTRGSDGLTFTLSGMNLGATVAAGAWVEIDMDARTVMHSSGANYRRYLAAGSSWMTLTPGTDTYTISVTSATTGAYLEIDVRSAWLA